MFTYQQVYDATLKYFNDNDLPAKIFVDKYALRDNENNILEKTPDEMHRRLAREFARVEKNKFKKPLTEEEIYELFKNFEKIIPQGSPLTGIGNNYQVVSLSNCYVVPPTQDSYGGILLTDQHIVQISKRRGGIGYDISGLRPKEMSVRNAARTTTGAISFMHRFSHSGREVGQNNRRGAQMICISVHHPDILDFINVKNDEVSVTGANISVRLSNDFLLAVKKNTDYELRWPLDNPKIRKKINARDIWKQIIHCAWLRAEPGLLFWDNILLGPADCYEQFRSTGTNPCSEIPLSNYDSCRLMAMNLFGYVKNPFSKDSFFDYNQFYKDVQIAQRLMDDLIDLELEKIDQILAKIENDPEPLEIKRTELELWTNIKKACIDGRRTGLGILGLADTLAAIGIKYGSQDSIEETNKIYKTLKFGAYRSSVDMAKELGSFPVWNYEVEKDNEFLNRIESEKLELSNEIVYGKNIYDEMKWVGRRNIALLTTAPTGTISILAKIGNYHNISSGIEPVFMLEFIRRKKINHDDKNMKVDFVDKVGDKWTNFSIYHSGFQLWKDITGKSNVKDSPYAGALANEIDWTERVKLQANAQRHICHAISSTINLPETVTEEEVAKIYETSWECGLKGITVYRNNCRSGVLIEKKADKSVKTDKRPKELPCEVHHITVKGKPYFCLVGLSGGTPYEVFAGKNGFIDKKVKTGTIIKNKRGYKCIFDDESEVNPINMSCDEHEDALTRLVSMSLRHDVSIPLIMEQLDKVMGDMTTFAKCISRALKKYVPDGTKLEGQKCPECAGELVMADGCKKCVSCGYSGCS